MKLPDIKEFNPSEMFNDTTGKSQALLFCSVIGFIFGTAGIFVALQLDNAVSSTAITAFMSIVLSCSAMLGSHVWSKDKPLQVTEDKESKENVEKV